MARAEIEGVPPADLYILSDREEYLNSMFKTIQTMLPTTVIQRILLGFEVQIPPAINCKGTKLMIVTRDDPSHPLVSDEPRNKTSICRFLSELLKKKVNVILVAVRSKGDNPGNESLYDKSLDFDIRKSKSLKQLSDANRLLSVRSGGKFPVGDAQKVAIFEWSQTLSDKQTPVHPLVRLMGGTRSTRQPIGNQGEDVAGSEFRHLWDPSADKPGEPSVYTGQGDIFGPRDLPHPAKQQRREGLYIVGLSSQYIQPIAEEIEDIVATSSLDIAVRQEIQKSASDIKSLECLYAAEKVLIVGLTSQRMMLISDKEDSSLGPLYYALKRHEVSMFLIIAGHRESSSLASDARRMVHPALTASISNQPEVKLFDSIGCLASVGTCHDPIRLNSKQRSAIAMWIRNKPAK